jgi:hypothetical protein
MLQDTGTEPAKVSQLLLQILDLAFRALNEQRPRPTATLTSRKHDGQSRHCESNSDVKDIASASNLPRTNSLMTAPSADRQALRLERGLIRSKSGAPNLAIEAKPGCVTTRYLYAVVSTSPLQDGPHRTAFPTILNDTSYLYLP